MTICGRIVQRLDPRLGPARRRAAAARRRDHQPQLPGPLRRRRLRDPGARARTPTLLGIDRERGADRQRARRARSGSRPRVAAMLDDPPAIVTEFVEGRGMTAGGAARARDAERGGALAAGDPRERRAAAEPTSTPSGSSRPTPRPRVGRGATLPDGLRASAQARGGGDRSGAERPRARAGALPQRPARRQLHRRTPSGCGSSTGSTRGWATATSTSATSRSTTSSTSADEEALLAAYFGEPPSRRQAGGAAADAVHVRLPRGDVGRRAEVVSELDFDFADYADKHFERLRRPRPTRASAAGSRRPVAPPG